MKDISEKINTLRHATAQAFLRGSSKTIEKVKKGKVPKGNVLEIARTAGIMAAKKCSELIPYCHQIPLDWIDVDFKILKEKIIINTNVKAIWKTGVEMEALTAASITALTIYDMLKPLDDSLEISSIKLIEKHGGKSDWKQQFKNPIKTAVLVFSDSISKNKKEDKSGKAIIKKLENEIVEIVEYKIYPDDTDKIKKELIRLSDEGKIDLILTTGGTGLGPRDNAVEATKDVIDREVPGISEAIRLYGYSRTPYSMLSRGISGIRGKTIIINLPGSTKGASESVDALFPWVLHSFWVLRGGGHDKK
jgi:molybdenum cofactor biosynthesis protein MoaC